MKLFTIGFTRKTAEQFFGLISNARVKRIIDVRLNNASQLAGFSKRVDLEYFAKQLCSADYSHITELAPTQDILDAFKKHGGTWEVYEQEFNSLMAERRIEDSLSKELFDNSCLLCSEELPEHCHRRLVVEYLSTKWSNVKIEHL